MTTTSASRSLIGNSNYRLWWAGCLISDIGNAMALIAIPLIILDLTGSPLRAGVAGALEALPYALLSLPAGVLADRVSRRALLTGSCLASALATAWIPVAYWLGMLYVPEIYLVALVNGAAGVVFVVTQTAVIPRLVSEEHLGPAAGQAELIFNLSAIIGPPLAGLLLAAWLALPMLIDAVSFAAMAFALLAIRAGLGPDAQARPPSWRGDLTTGLRKVLANPRLRALTIINIAGDLLFAGIAVLMTVVLRHSGASPAEIGLNFSLAAIGGVTGSVLASRMERWLGMATAVMTRSWIVAILFPLFGLGLAPFLIGVIWCLVNLMIAVMNVVQLRYIMTSMPDEVLGRVQSFVTFASYSVLPLGTLLTGALLGSFGPRTTVFCFSGAFVLIACYATASRGLRGGAGQPSEEAAAEKAAT